MKPNSALTGVENILSLIGAVNPGLVIQPHQVSLSSPLPDEEVEGRASLTLFAELDKGFSGSAVVTYVRHPLTPYLVDTDYVFIEGTETSSELLTKIAQHHGLVSTELTVDVSSLPGNDGSQVATITISTIPDSLVYLPSSVSINLTTVEFTEETRYTEFGVPRVSTTGIVRFKAPPSDPDV